MARLVFALNQSLDGYVDHMAFSPDPVLFRHFIDDVRGLAGCVYGRRMYETMRYWDEDRPEWDEAERDYAAAWRRRRKWVVSRSLKSVGPNATLVADDVEATIRELKARLDGVIEIAGPELAASLTGLVDEYRLYLHPVVLGGGKPLFARPRPPAAPRGERPHRRGRDHADLRPGIAPTIGPSDRRRGGLGDRRRQCRAICGK